MFKNQISIEKMNAMGKNTIAASLGIEFTEIGENYLTARMPVDARTHQPFGILHGGASVVLSESLGSLGAWMCLDDPSTQKAVGLDINANHLRGVSSGWVYGKATPIHIGKKTQVWDIKITNEENKMVCISRLTVAVV